MVVTEELPAGLTYLSHSASSGSFNYATHAWTITPRPETTIDVVPRPRAMTVPSRSNNVIRSDERSTS